MGMGGGMMGGMASSDPAYAGYLANGRITAGAAPITVRPGERLRLRIVNAAAATTFRVGLTGHRLVVTHTDGQEVEPVTVDTLDHRDGRTLRRGHRGARTAAHGR